MKYGIAEEGGMYRVYRLLDPRKAEKENNRRYLASSDREDRARELMDAFKTLPEPEVEDERRNDS